eukprot:gb/GEZN01002813.1/.p1 GENE.gb/GEZN01002813.1/~~gb/GEZN01002813.1/.p1  ORF type:complete len:458 (+),score=49.00 gb/GEZN01002813.1/:479-1852(+)
MSVTVKVALGKDLRRIQIPDLQFASLYQKCRSTFALEKTKFLYVDNEGDLITIANDAELEEAFQLSKLENKILKLQLEPVQTGSSRSLPSKTSTQPPSQLSSNSNLRHVLASRSRDSYATTSGSASESSQSGRTMRSDRGSASGSGSGSDSTSKSRHNKNSSHRMSSDYSSGSDRGGVNRSHSQHSGSASQSDWRSNASSGSTSTRSSGVYKAKFIKDLSLPDRTEVRPNQVIIKTWQLLNTGNLQWPMGSAVKLFRSCGGAVTDPNSRFPVPCAKPGETVDVSAIITTPDAPGRCRAFFRLCDLDGRFFGPRMWMDITVIPTTSTSEDNSCTTSMDDSDYAEGCDPCFMFDELRVEDELKNQKEEAAEETASAQEPLPKNSTSVVAPSKAALPKPSPLAQAVKATLLEPEKKISRSAMEKDLPSQSLSDALSKHTQKLDTRQNISGRTSIMRSDPR